MVTTTSPLTTTIAMVLVKEMCVQPSIITTPVHQVIAVIIILMESAWEDQTMARG